MPSCAANAQGLPQAVVWWQTHPTRDGQAAKALQLEEALLGLEELCSAPHGPQGNTAVRKVVYSLRRCSHLLWLQGITELG